MKTIPNI